jgi:hypothetical protein
MKTAAIRGPTVATASRMCPGMCPAASILESLPIGIRSAERSQSETREGPRQFFPERVTMPVLLTHARLRPMARARDCDLLVQTPRTMHEQWRRGRSVVVWSC